MVELFGGWKPMCFNCSGQLLTLTPMPATIKQLKEIVSRERRRTDRRFGKADTRVFRYERRVGQRRSSRDQLLSIDDDMIIEVTVEPEVDAGMEFDDITAIRELIHDLRPSELAS